ncbi:MAG TPA: alkaline phosphatase [Melioribacteraceae bacterium]|nr:alkaline phosphatase [Melioribacteraceae bacterium]
MKKTIFSILAVVVFTTAFYCQDTPKNIIFMIGDGMSINSVGISEMFFDNSPFRKFTHTGLVVTVAADKLITDSAAGATAFSTGYRTNKLMVAYKPDSTKVETILEFLSDKGYATGIIATSSLTDATPACFGTHSISRYNFNDIAEQYSNLKIDYLVGGGTQYFLPENMGGARTDGKNIVENFTSKGFNFVDKIEDVINYNKKEPLFGLIGYDEMPEAWNRKFSLGEVTKSGLNYLSNTGKNFFIMVEGSQIDNVNHGNNKDGLIAELSDFNTAVNCALNFAEKDKNTLVVVIADHDTGGLSVINGDLNKKQFDIGWTTKNHAANMVAVFAKGPGAEKFTGILDNYQIGRILFEYFGKTIK